MKIIAYQKSVLALVLLCISIESVDSFSAGSKARCYSKSPSTTIFSSSSSSSSAAVVEDDIAITRVEDTNDQSKNKSKEDELIETKRKLLEILGKKKYLDPVLADPITKEPLEVSASGGIMGGSLKYQLFSSSNNKMYGGTSDTYLNLLKDSEITEENNEEEEENKAKGPLETIVRSAIPLLVPPQLRQTLTSAGLSSVIGDDYVPMRDLFTSPAVSFAYERGWRQNFATAGFPGPDNEAEMASEYFAPAISSSDSGITTLVDMSCATGLFTRRFAKSGDYDRVLGCDYSSSMLQEARRRINSEKLTTKTTGSTSKNTQLELVRLDVGQIPMQDNSVDVLHAGAAMHCWPDLPSAVSEIRRVLKPGGRYFATTFLSSYFRALRLSNDANGGAMDVSKQAFQYFESVEVLRDLLVNEGGFDKDKVEIELLKPAAIVIRCEK